MTSPLTVADIARLRELMAKATPGPYFVAADPALDTIAHRNSGLALIDTGRTGDSEWPVLRLGEWPTTEAICALLNATPALLDLAERGMAAQWVSVEERLPEIGVPALAHWTWDRQLVDECPDSVATWNGAVWHLPGDEDDDYAPPTHWQLLPKPPEGT